MRRDKFDVYTSFRLEYDQNKKVELSNYGDVLYRRGRPPQNFFASELLCRYKTAELGVAYESKFQV